MITVTEQDTKERLSETKQFFESIRTFLDKNKLTEEQKKELIELINKN